MPRRKLPSSSETELVEIDRLKPHPQNYREHPVAQVEHLAHSLQEFGQYRNVVVANDFTILAGHGVFLAAKHVGMKTLSVARLPLAPDDPRALKLLAADNELGRFAINDDRALTELLLAIRNDDALDGLPGTGYDDEMLAALVFVTRPASEIKDMNAARQWVGMPTFEEGGDTDGSLRIVIHFETEEDRTKFMELIGATVVQKRMRGTDSLWWPEKEKEDLASLRFVDEDE